jgi:hypothetical protein
VMRLGGRHVQTGTVIGYSGMLSPNDMMLEVVNDWTGNRVWVRCSSVLAAIKAKVVDREVTK